MAHPSGFTTQQQSLTSLQSECEQHWYHILHTLGSQSSLWDTIQHSKNPTALAAASLARHSPTTIIQYVRPINQFLDFFHTQGTNLADINLAQLNDFLLACQQTGTEDRRPVKSTAKQMLKALSWLAQTAQAPALLQLTPNKLTRSLATPH